MGACNQREEGFVIQLHQFAGTPPALFYLGLKINRIKRIKVIPKRIYFEYELSIREQKKLKLKQKSFESIKLSPPF